MKRDSWSLRYGSKAPTQLLGKTPTENPADKVQQKLMICKLHYNHIQSG